MPEAVCQECGNDQNLPDGYDQPFFKCSICGSNQKFDLPDTGSPRYQILKNRPQKNMAEEIADLSKRLNETSDSQPVSCERRRVSQPVIVSQEKKTPSSFSDTKRFAAVVRPIGERKFLEDALGEHGMELVLQVVAGYMGELNVNRRKQAKIKAIQRLMRSKISADIASRAINFAEKSPEIENILLSDYKSSLIRGLLIFAIGVVISVLVYVLANPGGGFVIFQLPFAVGLAYAANAAINIFGLKNPALRNEKVHYAFIIISAMVIALYVAVGLML